MNLKEELLKKHSKEHTKTIAVHIGNRKDKMSELMSSYISEDQELARKAAWVLNHVHDLFPIQSDPFQSLIIKTLNKSAKQDAVKRAGLRTLADKYITEENLGETAELCFNILNGPEEAVAVKVHAMEILKNIVKRVPELRDELMFSLEEQYPYQTSGFKNRALKIMAFLNTLK